MKTFRFIGAAILAVVMCVNFTSCGEDPFGNGGGDGNGDGDIIENGGSISKKLTKIITEDDGDYIFEYDNEGHLATATHIYTYDNGVDFETETSVYEFVWGDDAIRVKKGDYQNYTLTLSNGLVQSGDDKTYSYNNSNRFVKGVSEYSTTTVIWNGDKMVNFEEKDNDEQYGENWEVSLTYGETCKKGYMPMIPYFIDFGCEVLFMAHPEIVGMRTNQLPITYKTEDGTISMTYTLDKEGYVSEMAAKLGSKSVTYKFTWE